jgi:hypothetical protein
MTRKPWTSDSQEQWLKARIDTYLKAHQDKSLSKEFFPQVEKDFCDQWPVPQPTAEEIAAMSTVEQAKKVKCKKYDQVCSSIF